MMEMPKKHLEDHLRLQNLKFRCGNSRLSRSLRVEGGLQCRLYSRNGRHSEFLNLTFRFGIRPRLQSASRLLLYPNLNFKVPTYLCIIIQFLPKLSTNFTQSCKLPTSIPNPFTSWQFIGTKVSSRNSLKLYLLQWVPFCEISCNFSKWARVCKLKQSGQNCFKLKLSERYIHSLWTPGKALKSSGWQIPSSEL